MSLLQDSTGFIPAMVSDEPQTLTLSNVLPSGLNDELTEMELDDNFLSNVAQQILYDNFSFSTDVVDSPCGEDCSELPFAFNYVIPETPESNVSAGTLKREESPPSSCSGDGVASLKISLMHKPRGNKGKEETIV